MADIEAMKLATSDPRKIRTLVLILMARTESSLERGFLQRLLELAEESQLVSMPLSGPSRLRDPSAA